MNDSLTKLDKFGLPGISVWITLPYKSNMCLVLSYVSAFKLTYHLFLIFLISLVVIWFVSECIASLFKGPICSQVIGFRVLGTFYWFYINFMNYFYLDSAFSGFCLWLSRMLPSECLFKWAVVKKHVGNHYLCP